MGASTVAALNLVGYFFTGQYLIPSFMDIKFYLGLSGFAILTVSVMTLKDDLQIHKSSEKIKTKKLKI